MRAEGYILKPRLYRSKATPVTFEDMSPFGNNCTITGATWTRLPSGLWVLRFDGTDDYVTKASDVRGIKGGTQASIEICINADQEANREWILGCGDTNNAYTWFGISHETSKKLRFFWGVLANNNYAVSWTSTNDFTLATYQHLIFTYNNSASPKTAVYLNGAAWAGTDTGIGGSLIAITTYLTIGTRRNNAVYELDFDGDLDIRGIYDYALDGDQVYSKYQSVRSWFEV